MINPMEQGFDQGNNDKNVEGENTEKPSQGEGAVETPKLEKIEEALEKNVDRLLRDSLDYSRRHRNTVNMVMDEIVIAVNRTNSQVVQAVNNKRTHIGNERLVAESSNIYKQRVSRSTEEIKVQNRTGLISEDEINSLQSIIRNKTIPLKENKDPKKAIEMRADLNVFFRKINQKSLSLKETIALLDIIISMGTQDANSLDRRVGNVPRKQEPPAGEIYIKGTTTIARLMNEKKSLMESKRSTMLIEVYSRIKDIEQNLEDYIKETQRQKQEQEK